MLSFIHLFIFLSRGWHLWLFMLVSGQMVSCEVEELSGGMKVCVFSFACISSLKRFSPRKCRQYVCNHRITIPHCFWSLNISPHFAILLANVHFEDGLSRGIMTWLLRRNKKRKWPFLWSELFFFPVWSLRFITAVLYYVTGRLQRIHSWHFQIVLMYVRTMAQFLELLTLVTRDIYCCFVGVTVRPWSLQIAQVSGSQWSLFTGS